MNDPMHEAGLGVGSALRNEPDPRSDDRSPVRGLLWAVVIVGCCWCLAVALTIATRGA